MNQSCTKCGVLFWFLEVNSTSNDIDQGIYKCCRKDMYHFTPMPRPPRFLEKLLMHDAPPLANNRNRTTEVSPEVHRVRKFRANIRSYNTALSITSLSHKLSNHTLDYHRPTYFQI